MDRGHLIAGIAILIAGLAIIASYGADPTLWIDPEHPIGPIAFAGLYAALVVVLVPGSALTLAAGALYGPWIGILVVIFGASIGALLAFGLARSGRTWIGPRMGEVNRYLSALDAAIASDGLRVGLLLRLSPLVPFSLLNHALGASNMRFRDAVISLIAMLPAITVYVLTGHLAGSFLRASRGQLEAPTEAALVLNIIGLIATITVSMRLTRLAREHLADLVDEEE